MNLPGKWSGLMPGAVIVLLTMAVYVPVMRAGFIWDDDTHLTRNLITESDGLYRSWLTMDQTNYRPLTWTSAWAEWRLWGMRAAGYHVVNVVLHAVSSLLVWRVLRRLEVPGAWLAALIYAVHPVNVESVAWITQRKNVLSMMFYALSLLLYLRFEAEGRRPWYVFSIGSFLLSLLSKTAAVMMPFVLLLCAWWQRGRIGWKDLLRSVPFFVLSGLLGLVELKFEYAPLMDDEVVGTGGFFSRLAVAGWAVWFYLYKAVIPYKLTFIYPRWQINPFAVLSYVPVAALLACFALLWRFRRTWGRPLLAGLGYFVVTLIPVLGFRNIYYMKYSLVADHWQYVSIVGVIALIAGAGVHFAGRWRPAARGTAAVLAAVVIVLLSLSTCRQERIYQNKDALWRDTIEKNPRAWMAHYNLGIALAGRNELDEAMACFREAIRIKPRLEGAYNNLGLALAKLGKINEAIANYLEELRINPECENAHNNLGNALVRQGKIDDAILYYSGALRIKPDFFEAHFNLGNAFGKQGRIDEAVARYSEAVRIRPGHAAAHYNLGNALAKRGAFDKAVAQYREALKIEPGYAGAHVNMGNAYSELGSYPQAIKAYRQAIRIKPGLVSARCNLGMAYLSIGDADSAISEYYNLRDLDGDAAARLFNSIEKAGGHLP